MYGRRIDGREIHLEPSGGLLHATIVMQDDETDSYWFLMSDSCLSGEYRGTTLERLPAGVKIPFGEWRALHPETTVLEEYGESWKPEDIYADFFSSPRGFRGAEAADDRLETKDPVYAFRMGGVPYAVPFAAFEGGAVFDVEGTEVFLYREAGWPIRRSSLAYTGGIYAVLDGEWGHFPSALGFRRGVGFPRGGASPPAPLTGMDTFWFNWSMSWPETKVLTEGIEGRKRTSAPR